MQSNNDKPENIAGYEIIHAVQLDKCKAVVVGANHKAVQSFVTWQRSVDKCGRYAYDIGHYYGTHAAALVDFGERLAVLAQERVDHRRSQQLTDELFTTASCIDGSKDMDYTHQIVVLDPAALGCASQLPEYQLIYITHGSGGRAGSHYSKTVTGYDLYTEKCESWGRCDTLGIIKPDLIPAWAHRSLKRVKAETIRSGDSR